MKKGKPAGIQLLIQVVVRDPDGNVISDTGRKPAQSFLIQFLEFLYGMFSGASSFATAQDGTEDPICYTTQAMFSHLRIRAPVNSSVFGIVVGTGVTAETNEDYKLETQLTEGTGAGNITHGEQVVGSAAVVGSNVDLELTRAFTNLTGSTITVKEVGLYCVTFSYYFCIIRDVLAASVDVTDKCSITVIYTVRTTV